MRDASTLVPAVAALVQTACSPGEPETRVDVQGHRGARGLAPENTLPSFEWALDFEVDTLELDLHWSADSKLVVWHDPVIDARKCRIDPGAPAPRPPDPAAPGAKPVRVRSLTLAQLNGYRCDRNPDRERFPEQRSRATQLARDDYRIVDLAAVLDFVDRYARSDEKTPAQRRAASRVRFNLETKREPEQPDTIADGFDGATPGPFERALARIVSERGLTRRVTVQSFDHRSLWALRGLAPDIELSALTAEAADLPDLARRGARVWSPHYEEVTPERLQGARALGLRVVPWTVNEPEAMRRLLALGIDGIITDRPDLLRALLPADPGERDRVARGPRGGADR